jgi:D-ribose pyranose/furanose isomerase RbsD
LNYLNSLSWFPNRWHANPYFGYIIRKKILKKIDGIIVEYPPFVDLLKDTYNVSKPVYFLPKRTYSNFTTTKVINKTVFVIPGMISQVRREYDLVIDAFQNIPKEIQSSIKLIILGRPIKKYGLKIIERLKKLDKSVIEIEYFTKFISHEKFSQSLLQADVIIAPIKLDYYSGIINEKFTYTKGTGTFHDMLRYSKPTIVPSVYNVAKEFEDCFIKYRDSSELSSLIVELSTNENKISKQKELTLETIKKYSLINVQLMFEKLYEI